MVSAIAAPLIMLGQDIFVDTDNTSLDVHAMDVGSGWTEHAGAWITSSNNLVQSTALGGYFIATSELGDSSLRVRIVAKTVAASGDHQSGVVGRFSDTSNYWMANYDTSASQFSLTKVEAGTGAVQASVAWTPRFQSFVEVEIEFSGNTITAWIDGGRKLTVTSAFNNTATRFGVMEYRDATYKANVLDAFEAIDLPTYPQTRVGVVLSGTEVWENTYLLEPSVIVDTNPVILTSETQVFKMWYRAGGGSPAVGYAESTDGISWTKYSSNPIVTNVSRVFVGKFSGTYYLYAANNLIGGGVYQYDLYTSSDGVSFSLDTADVLHLGASGQWDDLSIGNPWVWKEGSNWFMQYECYDGIKQRSGLATSADGRAWTKSPSNPTLDDYGGPTGGPTYKIGSYYYLWAHRNVEGFNFATHINRYRSTNLTNWEPWPAFSIVPRETVDEGVNSDTAQTADPAVITYNGTAYLYYSATPNSLADNSFKIKLITFDALGISGY